MAKKWRGERDILTIDLCLDIPVDQLPDGVDYDEARTIKISAYPAVWRYLEADFSLNAVINKSKLPKILKEATSKACGMMPRKRWQEDEINSVFLGAELSELLYREEREEKGVHKRGQKAKAPDIYMKINYLSRWLHVLFRYYNKKIKDRPLEVKNIYTAKTGRRDPNDMTYFCCAILYESDLASLGLKFLDQESFRTKYLAAIGKFRPLVNESPEQVFQRINDPKSPLHIVNEICRKLQK